jgi:xanthine dehydrogenase YagS FAD-binding subunit
VPLIAHEARIKVAGPSGEREVPAAEFFVMPDRKMYGENVLEPNELVREVRVPVRANTRAATYEVRYKQSHDWPIVFATVVLSTDGTRVRGARVVLGAVAPVPWRSREAEKELAGQAITEAVAERAASAAVAGAKPMTQNGYKVQVTRTAVKRAILAAAENQPARSEV